MDSRRRISHLPLRIDRLPRSRQHVNGLPRTTREPSPLHPEPPIFIFTGTIVPRKALREVPHRFAASELDPHRHPGDLAAINIPECAALEPPVLGGYSCYIVLCDRFRRSRPDYNT
jgi:hypothetical protein